MYQRPLLSFLVINFIFVFRYVQAESFYLQSIEWLTTASDQIVLAKIDGKRKPVLNSVLKTNGYRDLPKFERSYLNTLKYSKWQVGDEVLIFSGIKNDEKQPEAFYTIVLNEPTRELHSAINQSGKLLKTKESILKTVQQRLALIAKSKSSKHVDPFMSSILPLGFILVKPPGNDIGRLANFEGIVVPADPEFRDSLVKRLKSPEVSDRVYAAARLVNYPDREVITLLKAALKDRGTLPYSTNSGPDGKPLMIDLLIVRQAAYDALTELGHKVEKPEGYLDGYHLRYW